MADYNHMICSTCSECLALRRQFFTASNYLIVLIDHCDAYIFRSGDFVMTDRRLTDRRTEPIALPLEHARGVTITYTASH